MPLPIVTIAFPGRTSSTWREFLHYPGNCSISISAVHISSPHDSSIRFDTSINRSSLADYRSRMVGKEEFVFLMVVPGYRQTAQTGTLSKRSLHG